MFKKRGSTTTLAVVICTLCVGLGVWYGISSQHSDRGGFYPPTPVVSPSAGASSVGVAPGGSATNTAAVGYATFSDPDSMSPPVHREPLRPSSNTTVISKIGSRAAGGAIRSPGPQIGVIGVNPASLRGSGAIGGSPARRPGSAVAVMPHSVQQESVSKTSGFTRSFSKPD